MKRLIAILLILTLLAGCTMDRPTESTQETEPPTTNTTLPPPPSLYEAGSMMEQLTDGAVQVYPLDGYCDGMILLNDRVVLYYLDEQMMLRAYSGDTLCQDVTVNHHITIPAKAQGIQTTEQGFSYYNPGAGTLVIMDTQLRQKHLVELSGDIQGIPVVSNDMSQVFFCTAEGIRAMDLSTGIAHMLRQQENYSGIAYGQCFDGSIMICTVTGSDGNTAAEFVSTETGMQVGRDPQVRWVESKGQMYLLERVDDQRVMYLFGTQAGEVQEFLMPANAFALQPALALESVLTVTDTEDGLTLDLYSLESGSRTASVTLTGLEYLRNVVADPRGYIWFMDESVLYRWEVSKSAVTDETVYTSPWYTGSDPNEAGLARCQTDADSLSVKYGLELRIWKDAVKAPWEKMTPEFRVSVYDALFPELETVFGLFPENMLKKMGSICDSNRVSVSIVADTGMEHGQVVWEKGDVYIAVEPGENLHAELLRSLYRVMDTYVLNETSMLDEWDADKPVEDRAKLFLEALTADNDAFFETRSNQNKLRTLCRAIRSAFGMKKYEAELPWEQYLNKPLY